MKKSPEAVLEHEEEGRGLLAPMTVPIDDDGLDENDPRRRRDPRMAGLAPESHAGRNSPRPDWSRPTCRTPWGLGADANHQLIIDDELKRANVRLPINPDRHRLGRTDHPLRRHRRAAAALAAEALERRGVLVPALQ